MYDNSVKFYTQLDDDGNEITVAAKKEKPVYIRDYHRQNILNGVNGTDEEMYRPKTYDEEQADLKASIVKEMHDAAANKDEDEKTEDGSGSDDDFLKAKEKPERQPKPASKALDVENADRDPETFLSNFMSSRAWAAHEKRSETQPFDSDDEEEERRAEDFEQAYNFRFEDPTKANEKLMSHARDVASRYSVRREEPNARQKHRETAREKKEAAKQETAEEKARLRKLRIEEMEERVRRIKRAAGVSGRTLNDEDWKKFLDKDWDDNQWDGEMAKHFGDEYYAAEDAASDDETATSAGKRKPKKPKWDDDIDIKDLVPDFEEAEQPTFDLSEVDDGGPSATKKTAKQLNRERSEKKKTARLDRQKIEQIVDAQLNFEAPSGSGGFRYRETSPTSYGLTPRDILMAEDTQLNQFAGLKKLASFRDPEKKRKDAKNLGKKARLRMWRRETFGDEEGPKEQDFEPEAPVAGSEPVEEEIGVDIRGEGGDKKKRRRRGKKEQKMAS